MLRALQSAPRRLQHIKREVIVPRSLDDAFSFFADASNLEELTPPWVNFKIITPTPIDMKPGAVIDYCIRVRGLPLKWRTVIDTWDPPHRFVDRQTLGPYKWWHHEHRFEAIDGSRTRVIDEVAYAARLGFITEPLMVNRDVAKIFDYRTEQLRQIMA